MTRCTDSEVNVHSFNIAQQDKLVKSMVNFNNTDDRQKMKKLPMTFAKFTINLKMLDFQCYHICCSDAFKYFLWAPYKLLCFQTC